MNTYKKISPVYALQVLAVILLFAYKGPMPETEPGAILPHKVLMPKVKNNSMIKKQGDSLLTGEMNSLSILYSGFQNMPMLLQKKSVR